jgi:hypothetical protein
MNRYTRLILLLAAIVVVALLLGRFVFKAGILSGTV